MDLGKGFSPSGDLYIFPENAAFNNNNNNLNSISVKGKDIAEMRPLHVEKKKQLYGKQKYSCSSIPLLSFSRELHHHGASICMLMLSEHT